MSIKKEFLVKKSTQQQLIIGLNELNQLYTCSELNPTDKSLISKDKVLDYSVDVDIQDNVHMVVLNTSGELKYFLNQGKSWGNKTIAKFDIRSNHYRYMKIFALDQCVHLVYATSNLLQPGLWTVKHSMFNQSKWKNFRVCDIFSGKYITPFIMDRDKKNNLYIVYRAYSKSEDNSHIFLSKFSSMYQVWSTPEKLSTTSVSNNYPFLFVDKKDTLHLCWSSIIKNNLHVCYSRKDTHNPKAQWTEFQVISENNTNCLSPVIYEYDDHLYINWVQGDGIYSKSSKDKGVMWSKPKLISENREIKIVQYQYISKLEELSSELKSSCFYGYWDNRVRPLGIEERVVSAVALAESINSRDLDLDKKLEDPEIKAPIFDEGKVEKGDRIVKLNDKSAVKPGLETKVYELELIIKEMLSSISSLEANYNDIIVKLDDIEAQHTLSSKEADKIRKDYVVLNHQFTQLNSSLQDHMDQINSINSQYVEIINKIQIDYQRLNRLLEENIESSSNSIIKKIKEFIKQKNQ